MDRWTGRERERESKMDREREKEREARKRERHTQKEERVIVRESVCFCEREIEFHVV